MAEVAQYGSKLIICEFDRSELPRPAIQHRNHQTPPPACEEREWFGCWIMRSGTVEHLHDETVQAELVIQIHPQMSFLELRLNNSKETANGHTDSQATGVSSCSLQQQPSLIIDHRAIRQIWMMQIGKNASTVPCSANAITQTSTRMASRQAGHSAELVIARLDFDERFLTTTSLFDSTPHWARTFARTVKEGSVYVLMDDSQELRGCMHRIAWHFLQQRTGCDFFDWQRPSSLEVAVGAQPITSAPPLIPAQRQDIPHYTEYLQCIREAITSEHKSELTQRTEFEEKLHHLKIIRFSNSVDDRLLGFLQMPPGDEFRPAPGTKLEIDFSQDVNFLGRRAWPAQVAAADHLNYPAGYLPLAVHWPWSRGEHRASAVLMEQIYLVNGESIKTAVEQADGRQVELRVYESDKVFKRSLDACRKLEELIRGPDALPWNKKTLDLTVAQDYSNLPMSDIFAGVSFTQMDLSNSTNLNPGQIRCIEAAAVAPLGVQVIHGPAGTGKSYTVSQYTIPFLKSSEHSIILVVSTTNRAADLLARILDKQLQDLQQKKEVSDARYLIRLHSENTEQGVINGESFVKRMLMERSKDKGQTPAGRAVLALQPYADASTKRRHVGLRDDRVQELSLSAGVRMLQLAKIKSSEGLNIESSTNFSTFVCHFRDLVHRDQWDILQEKEYAQAYHDLYAEALQRASIIVATTATASSPELLQIIGQYVSLVIVDEAARVRDDLLIPLFAAPFSKDPGLVLVGDHQQLAPFKSSQRQQNTETNRLAKSLMTWLLEHGFPVNRLVTQYRMVPQISALTNNLIYDGTLLDHHSVQPKERPLAQIFRTFLAKLRCGLNGDGQHVIYVDLLKSGYCTVTKTMSESRSNQFIVVWVVNCLVDLLEISDSATIGVITGYAAQRTLYISALTEMKNRKVKGVDRVTIDTIDATQGEEFDFVILDLLVGATAGFLDDTGRLNVALTRARNGMIIVGIDEDLQRCAVGNPFLQKVRAQLLPYRWTVRDTVDFPPCEYFSPSY